MPVRHELTFTGEALHRFTFEDAFRAAEVIEYAAIEDEESGANQAVRFRFLHEALNLALGAGF